MLQNNRPPKISKTLLRWMQQYAAGRIFTAIDTETTGLDPTREKIVEIGAVKFNRTGPIASFSALIDPQKPMPYSAYRINGISDSMLAGKPLFKNIAQDLLIFISGSRLIAHGAQFDVDFLQAELNRAELPLLRSPLIPAIDTVKLSRLAFPQLKKHNLQALATSFNIEPGKAHRAEDDARVCMEVFIRCLNENADCLSRAEPLQDLSGSLFETPLSL